MLLLAFSLAHAGTDIATTKKFGIGAATGSALINVTGKYYLGPKNGLAFFAGTSFTYHDLRASYQGDFVHWGENWNWGQIGMYWHVDAQFSMYTVPSFPVYPSLGLGGGIGADMDFQKIPLQIFTEFGLGIYPLHGYCADVAATEAAVTGVDVSGICWVGAFGAAGVRWYP